MSVAGVLVWFSAVTDLPFNTHSGAGPSRSDTARSGLVSSDRLHFGVRQFSGSGASTWTNHFRQLQLRHPRQGVLSGLSPRFASICLYLPLFAASHPARGDLPLSAPLVFSKPRPTVPKVATGPELSTHADAVDLLRKLTDISASIQLLVSGSNSWLMVVQLQCGAVYAYPYGECGFVSRNGGSLEHLEYWSFLRFFASNFSNRGRIPGRTHSEYRFHCKCPGGFRLPARWFLRAREPFWANLRVINLTF